MDEQREGRAELFLLAPTATLCVVIGPPEGPGLAADGRVCRQWTTRVM